MTFVGGPYLEQFEQSFATYHNSRFCIGVGNGTDALEIALWALNLPEGSEVIVPANSFIATSEAVGRNRLKVVFADIQSDYTIDPQSVKARISSKTSAIIPVHLYGHPCDMDAIMELAASYGLRVVEDCAQAHGAMYDGQKVGTFGDAGTFSFYPGKNLGAFGDGGAIITNNASLVERCRMMANHGRFGPRDHLLEGRNSRLDGLQAAILNVKLSYLDGWIEQRQRIASIYNSHLDPKRYALPVVSDRVRHVWHLYVIRHPQRDKLMHYLRDKGVACGIHYPIALPKLAAYAEHRSSCTRFVACQQDVSLLSLPIGEHLEGDAMAYMLEALQHFEA
ncbi:MAG: DegT/DnrJ/EryC1/StrS family aminotransferase [Campylobacterales bacterium]|nr:DegT/DnrJ/EryC1/StrS family aminotransferase [Campylobacterales bacterium]